MFPKDNEVIPHTDAYASFATLIVDLADEINRIVQTQSESNDTD